MLSKHEEATEEQANAARVDIMSVYSFMSFFLHGSLGNSAVLLFHAHEYGFLFSVFHCVLLRFQLLLKSAARNTHAVYYGAWRYQAITYPKIRSSRYMFTCYHLFIVFCNWAETNSQSPGAAGVDHIGAGTRVPTLLWLRRASACALSSIRFAAKYMRSNATSNSFCLFTSD